MASVMDLLTIVVLGAALSCYRTTTAASSSVYMHRSSGGSKNCTKRCEAGMTALSCMVKIASEETVKVFTDPTTPACVSTDSHTWTPETEEGDTSDFEGAKDNSGNQPYNCSYMGYGNLLDMCLITEDRLVASFVSPGRLIIYQLGPDNACTVKHTIINVDGPLACPEFGKFMVLDPSVDYLYSYLADGTKLHEEYMSVGINGYHTLAATQVMLVPGGIVNGGPLGLYNYVGPGYSMLSEGSYGTDSITSSAMTTNGDFVAISSLAKTVSFFSLNDPPPVIVLSPVNVTEPRDVVCVLDKYFLLTDADRILVLLSDGTLEYEIKVPGIQQPRQLSVRVDAEGKGFIAIEDQATHKEIQVLPFLLMV